MPILKLFNEANGQQSMFGYDNLEFKTVNHPKWHRFIDLCSKFRIKKHEKFLLLLPTKNKEREQLLINIFGQNFS